MLKAHVSVSLDGFVAGAGIDAQQAMGRRGDELHEWLFSSPRDPVDAAVAAAMLSRDTVGAVLMGRRTFDVGLGHWGDDGAFGMPCFVVSHRSHDPIVKGPTTFTIVTDGLHQAAAQARAAAGDKHVNVMGAEVIRQLLVDALIDEIEIDLVPILLGTGTTLFGDLPDGVVRLEQVEVRPAATVTHLRYRVVG
jgi:dihydrofolate reductase